MNPARLVPSTSYREYPPDEMPRRAIEFRAETARRRTVREFSDRPVPRPLIEECLAAAGSAPSGANLQPWHFVAVSHPGIKARIRTAAEAEEREFYAHRAVPRVGRDGRRIPHYYATESVGIATGILVMALHHAGLATLTHTPSPMGFLHEILDRPANERPFLIVMTGYPASDAKVPDIVRKRLEEIATFLETPGRGS